MDDQGGNTDIFDSAEFERFIFVGIRGEDLTVISDPQLPQIDTIHMLGEAIQVICNTQQERPVSTALN